MSTGKPCSASSIAGAATSASQPTVAPEGREPGVDSRRNDGAEDAARESGVPAFREPVERCRVRPPAKTGNRQDLAGGRQIHDDRRDATQVGLVTLDDIDRQTDGHAGVDRVATFLEHPQASEAGQVVSGGDEMLPGNDWWTPRQRAVLPHGRHPLESNPVAASRDSVFCFL
jgi:hypothetical protein